MKSLSHATILGVLALVAVLGVIVLAATGHPIPDVLPALALAGVSALAGLAIPSGTGGSVLTTADAPATITPDDGTVGLMLEPANPQPIPAPATTVFRGGYGRPVE